MEEILLEQSLQESQAIAKMTAQCALYRLYICVVKIFDSP